MNDMLWHVEESRGNRLRNRAHKPILIEPERGLATLPYFMKKTFRLQAPGKDDARVRDKIRHEVNKYVRRSRRRELPEGYAQWEFTCKVGAGEAGAESRSFKEVAGAIDSVAEAGASEVYIEITAVPGQRLAGARDSLRPEAG